MVLPLPGNLKTLPRTGKQVSGKVLTQHVLGTGFDIPLNTHHKQNQSHDISSKIFKLNLKNKTLKKIRTSLQTTSLLSTGSTNKCGPFNKAHLGFVLNFYLLRGQSLAEAKNSLYDSQMRICVTNSNPTTSYRCLIFRLYFTCFKA